MRKLIDNPPYSSQSGHWSGRGRWPARWIAHEKLQPPFVTAYRLTVESASERVVRVHVTADERYELFLNGSSVGRGSERGDANNWFFETYDLYLPAGESTIVARVWTCGVDGDDQNLAVDAKRDPVFHNRARAPFAQISVHPGFLFGPDDVALINEFATGVANWQVKVLGGYEFIDNQAAWGCGARLAVHGDQFDWGYELGQGDGWVTPRVLAPGMDLHANDDNPRHLLRPGILPAQMSELRKVGKVANVSDPGESTSTSKIPIHESTNKPEEQAAWQSLISGEGKVTIPSNTRRRVLIDLGNYYTAYPELVTSAGKGASIRVSWEESLFVDEKASAKGNRDGIEGKYFTQMWSAQDGVSDFFYPDGGEARRFTTLWWECGRFVEVLVETKDEPLVIDSFGLRETRYPIEMTSRFEASDDRLTLPIPMMVRALQMCSHETYMDCPFYEQLMYIGDTRLEVLATFAISNDDRLPRKAIQMFEASRRPNGLTQSRYPNRVLQLIPPFSLWFVAMVHDFALWRGDMDLVKRLMPTARGVLDTFKGWTNKDGLIEGPVGWNFMDWVPAWDSGIPPEGNTGASAVINLQAALVLRLAAHVETWLGEPDLAARNNKWADHLMEVIKAKYWVASRGCYADDLAHTKFSEHSQCLAILEGSANHQMRDSMKRNLLEEPDLERTTIYFSHYLFEAYRVLGLGEQLVERLGMWRDLVHNGLKTTIEHPEPTRSDCHAWGAHPLYHLFATFAGIRPTKPGFAEVEIKPLQGGVEKIHAVLQTPKGPIEVKLDGPHIDVFIPEGIRGVVEFDGERRRIG